MEVTKKEAARILKVSPKEIMRRIDRGELKARKKGKSKFSDTLVTIPDAKKEKEGIKTLIEGEITKKGRKEAKVTPKPSKELKPEPELEPELEPKVELIEESKPVEEVKLAEDPKVENSEKIHRERRLEINRQRREDGKGKEKENKWWF